MAIEPRQTTSGARVPYVVIPDAAERARRMKELARRFAELDAMPETEEERQIDVTAALREDLGRGIIISDRDPRQ